MTTHINNTHYIILNRHCKITSNTATATVCLLVKFGQNISYGEICHKNIVAIDTDQQRDGIEKTFRVYDLGGTC